MTSSPSLLELLKQQRPKLQTSRGLVLCGLQNDFLSPNGKLPVTRDPDFFKNLRALVVAFRSFGHVIWIRSHFEESPNTDDAAETSYRGLNSPLTGSSRRSSKTDIDLIARVKNGHLGSSEMEDERSDSVSSSKYDTQGPCLVPGTHGAEYADEIKDLIDARRDIQLVQTKYSAFESTSLLMSLRSKLITELYVAGCISNLSVFATAMEAARYAIKITVVKDCLGYRRKDRHDLAIQQLRKYIDARVTTSVKALAALRNPSMLEVRDDDDESDDDEEEEEEKSEEAADATETELDGPSMLLAFRTARGTRETRSFPNQPSAAATRPGSSTDKSTATSKQTNTSDRSKRHSHESHGNKRRHSKLQDQLLSHRNASATGSAQSKTSSADIKSATMLDRHGSTAPNRGQPGQTQPLFGLETEQRSAGSYILYDFLPKEASASIFQELNDEITWQRMTHQTGEVPRLVCCQGTVAEDGSMPVYRHPSDKTLPLQAWTPVVDQIRRKAEQVVGHQLNHALIQLYRGGADFISEHSDKTLDIVPGTHIVNVSFGAQRTMRFRTKRRSPSGPSAATPGQQQQRTTFRVPMPHNSLLGVSLPTNAEFLHGINADKRPPVELSKAETAYGGQRISLTFRSIGTFLSGDSSRIWGLGAVGKTQAEARQVINGDVEEGVRLVNAFGRENQDSTLDWKGLYGKGFDVLHLK